MLLEETREHRNQVALAGIGAAVYRARVQQAEGMKISQLVADPNWELYGRYIEREKERHEASAKGLESLLLDTINPPDEKEGLKIRLRLAHNRACVEAYTLALTIAKTLIESGRDAEAEIAKLISVDNNGV